MASSAQALIRGKFLINLNNLVSWPMRTGIQRVCYEFCTRWPFIEDTIPFVELGMDRIGILGPDFFESVRQLFEDNDDTLRSLASEFEDLTIDSSPGWIGLFSARNRVLYEVPVEEALEACRAVLSLEESLNQEFYSLAAAKRPEKIFNLCHDFLSWTHPEYFSIDWRNADNICISLANRRKYSNNIFTSTTTRDIFINRINRGDRRVYRVIAPGADGLGRSFRKTIPDSSEFLVIGTLEPRKQSLHILRAFEQLQAQGHDARLCFAGRMGWLEAADKAELEAAFKRYSWLRWVDSPSDDELRDLMMECRATIYMSVAEGFGSPPVESLALGIPCIVTADLPSILDLSTNGQVRVEAADASGLVQAIGRLLDDDVLLALQAEIETLELPTWQGFVDGIAELVTQKTPLAAMKGGSVSYGNRLAALAALSLMRQLGRADFVERLVLAACPAIDERELARWQIEADRSGWSNVEVALNLMAAFPHALPARLVHDAVGGKLEVGGWIPPAFAQEWRARFRRLMQISEFPAFHEAIYTDLLARSPGPGEVAAQMPCDEREELRTAYLRGAIESGEYRERLAASSHHKMAEGYFDSVELATIGWKLQLLDQLDIEAAVQRALLLDSDTEFLEIASLDLVGQLPSRDARVRYKALLRARHGREKVLLHMLLSEACLRRVKEPAGHVELIRSLALRARLAQPRRIGVQAIPGMVNAVIAKGRSSFPEGFASFLGREPTMTERALAQGRQDGKEAEENARLFAARLVVYATLRGDIALSAPFFAWAAGFIVENGSVEEARKAARCYKEESAESVFASIFVREPVEAESAILAEIAEVGLSDVVRISGLRAGLTTGLISELAYFARKHEQLVVDFERLDMLAAMLLAAAPVSKPKPWSRPQPKVTANSSPANHPADGEPAFVVRREKAESEILTVDQLMAVDGGDFVRAAYRKLLLREADEGGFQTYLKVLRSGCSKAAVIYSLSISPEGRSADANLVGLENLLARQRKLRRWPVRKLLGLAGVKL